MKYEYKRVWIDIDAFSTSINTEINNYAKEGWELFLVSKYSHYFRRPIIKDDK